MKYFILFIFLGLHSCIVGGEDLMNYIIENKSDYMVKFTSFDGQGNIINFVIIEKNSNVSKKDIDNNFISNAIKITISFDNNKLLTYNSNNINNETINNPYILSEGNNNGGFIINGDVAVYTITYEDYNRAQ